MNDELDVNPDAPDAAPVETVAEAKVDFVDHPLYASLAEMIMAANPTGADRLRQILGEMRDLFNL